VIRQVLIVEDNPADARLVQESFKECGTPTRLHWVATGEEALGALLRSVNSPDVPPPDLVLLDLNLPGMRGQDVLAAIKTDAALKHVPVVILTSSCAPDDVLAAYDAHANAYMVKPTDFDQFVSLTRQLQHYWLQQVQLPSRPG